ncbi:hypothetical protein LZZ90_03735 [Flavobacterium sp. SM15]|uniref:hypothetical protein n=1 Tax=Flavobacterium sp. SM15 TaxID=2908005 RepID=UPI001EDB3AF6|nr:hypothetical protein [Flavobacterium sp. SM15]MCG2610613.1 hypothetical protein [Flavobacterium sp. SM15]
MKKIIALFVLFFAFSINANAQENKDAKTKASIELEAKANADLKKLIEVTNIEPSTHRTYYSLFYKKHRDFSKPNITDAERKSIMEYMVGKLTAGLKPEQIEALKKNSETFRILISQAGN